MQKQSASKLRFAIIGVAGYIARRHLDAIRQTGGEIVAAFDVFDSVGQMNDFKHARFFTDFAEFTSFIDRLTRQGAGPSYIVICSPNYLHRAHIEFALRAGADAICEKPLVLNATDIDGLKKLEEQTGKKIYSILQLRLNPDNQTLKADLQAASFANGVIGELTYITGRSQWYYASWKGDEKKSGGVATNIGVHFYDLLTYFFGRPVKNSVHHRAIDCAGGALHFKAGVVSWFLSINERDLPAEAQTQKQLNKATRQLIMGDRVCDLSGDFTQLHLASYREILAGRGFGLDTARPAIEIVSDIRHKAPDPDAPYAHPALKAVLNDNARYQDGLPV